jgi:hypothetical protein
MKFLAKVLSWIRKNPPPCPECEKEDHNWEDLTEEQKDDLRYFQKLVYRGLKVKPEDWKELCEDEEDCKLDR